MFVDDVNVEVEVVAAKAVAVVVVVKVAAPAELSDPLPDKGEEALGAQMS